MAKARGGLRVPPRRGLRGEQGEGYWEQEEGEPCYVCGAGKRERGAWGNPETCPGSGSLPGGSQHRAEDTASFLLAADSKMHEEGWVKKETFQFFF